MACIVLVCGIPGSGKSTLINYLSKSKFYTRTDCSLGSTVFNGVNDYFKDNPPVAGPRSSYDIVSVSYDELCSIPEQLRLVSIPNGWKDFRKDFLDAVEHYLCCLTQLECKLTISARAKRIFDHLTHKYSCPVVSDGSVILLVEDNFYYCSMRYKWFQVARKYEFGFCQIFLSCPVDVAVRRNFSRASRVPKDIIQVMSEKLELPDVQRNQWEKSSIVINTASDEMLKMVKSLLVRIEEVVRGSIANAPKQIPDVSEIRKEAQLMCSQNEIHQADKILRRHTNHMIQKLLDGERSKEELRTLTSRICDVRQKLLRELREGILCVPSNGFREVSNGANKDSEVEKHLCSLLENRINATLGM